MIKGAKLIGENVPIERYMGCFDEDGQPIQRGDARRAITRSDLMSIAHCPHRWRAGYKSEDTDSTDWGNIMDALLSGTFKDKYTEAPATYPAEPKKKGDPVIDKPWNRNATFCKEWEENVSRNGHTVLKREEVAEAEVAYRQLLADPDIKEMILVSQKQVMVTAEYHDRATGIIVPVKVLIDLVPDANHSLLGSCLCDFKTSASAAQWLWASFVDKYGYDMQAAFHSDIYNAATGEERFQFLHAIQENYPPYETGKRLLSERFVELGRIKYQNALAKYCQCLKTDTWPGYDGEEWILVEPTQRMEENAMRSFPAIELPPNPQPEQANEEMEICP